MMYWDDHGMNGWGYGLTMFGMLLFWGLLVAGGVLLFRYLGRTQQHPVPPPAPTAQAPAGRTDPEQLLAERLARGEIEPDEYRQRLDALRAGRGSGSG